MSRNPFLIGLVLVAFGSFGMIRSWVNYTEDTAIEREGARAEGHVAGKWWTDPEAGGRQYMVRYWFEAPGGQRIESEHKISAPLYDAVRPGDTIDVLYSRRDPRENFPEGHGATSRSSTMFSSIVSALFTLFGAALLVRHWPGQGRSAVDKASATSRRGR